MTFSTGSADKTVKLWHEGTCVRTIHAHLDCVRGLALLKSIGFVSCSNDGLVFLFLFPFFSSIWAVVSHISDPLRAIRVWSASGEVVQELYGHSSFVYAVDVLETGEIISSGEDRTVRVWKGEENAIFPFFSDRII